MLNNDGNEKIFEDDYDGDDRTKTSFMRIKGIRDAGSTAEFRILFEILKFKNLKIWKILEHLKKIRTFGKFEFFWKI